jgi:hypothetical protein
VKALRVGDAVYTIGPLACPRCGQSDHTRASYGIVQLHCTGKRCRVRWVALRLPPGVTGETLLDLYGEAVARAVHGALCPDADGCSQDALAAWVLPIPTTAPYYLQRIPDTPEPLMGWMRADHMLRSLMGAK